MGSGYFTEIEINGKVLGFMTVQSKDEKCLYSGNNGDGLFC